MTNTPRPTVNATAVVVSTTMLLLGLLAAAVALSYNGRDLDFILGLLTAVGTAGGLLVSIIGKLYAVSDETRHQTKQLETITEQTAADDQ
jgi:hypothetical protein